MAYDCVRGKVVLHGGYGKNDTWEWDGAQWTEITDPTCPISSDSAMAYDSVRGRCVEFGARNVANALNDFWDRDSGGNPGRQRRCPPCCGRPEHTGELSPCATYTPSPPPTPWATGDGAIDISDVLVLTRMISSAS